MLSQCADTEDGSLDEVIAGILRRKGRLLGQCGKPADALNCFDQLIQRFRSSNSPEIQAEIPWALLDMAVALHCLDRDNDAVKYCDEVLNLGADYPDQGVISAAQKRKTMVLETSNRFGEQPT
jgi:tetratricopeptide (TPR) repeat protein